MTYFDPEVYSVENLSEPEQREVKFWTGLIDNAVEFAKEEFLENSEDGAVISELKTEIVESFLQELERAVSSDVLEYIVYLIDRRNGLQ